MAEQVAAKHELSSVSTRGVFIFMAAFLATGACLHFFGLFTLNLLDRRAMKQEPSPSPIGVVRDSHLDQPLQPSPGHPTLPSQDLEAMKVEQNAALHSYAPISGNGSHARIPIDRAMQLLLDSGALKVPPKAADTQPYINTTQPASTENRT